jgi:DNA-binding IclR family transcriptional regulator
VPIFDHSEELQAALTVVMSSCGVSGTVRSEDIQFLKPLRETALEISRTLGSIDMAAEMASTM